MSEQQTFRLIHTTARRMAQEAVSKAPDGFVCVVRPPNRSLDQNAKAHALFQDIAKAKPTWSGINMDAGDWKALLIVSHAVATKTPGATRMVPDLEGHGLVQLRESSARMSKDRASSLIEYVQAWAVSHGIELREVP
jgi:hypothetical protein